MTEMKWAWASHSKYHMVSYRHREKMICHITDRGARRQQQAHIPELSHSPDMLSIMKLFILITSLLTKLAASYNLFEKDTRIVGGSAVRREKDF